MKINYKPGMEIISKEDNKSYIVIYDYELRTYRIYDPREYKVVSSDIHNLIDRYRVSPYSNYIFEIGDVIKTSVGDIYMIYSDGSRCLTLIRLNNWPKQIVLEQKYSQGTFETVIDAALGGGNPEIGNGTWSYITNMSNLLKLIPD